MISLIVLGIITVITVFASSQQNKDFNPNPAPTAPVQSEPQQYAPQPTQAHQPIIAPSPETAKFCPSCGAELSEPVIYCTYCGSEIE